MTAIRLSIFGVSILLSYGRTAGYPCSQYVFEFGGRENQHPTLNVVQVKVDCGAFGLVSKSGRLYD
ncbi:hypothetical protein [Imperialibacter sp.]|uniref:hypothetical protein n=1 Tax=Imperialibacter sp. TaxID=2038411 RepID=UPI0032EB5413